jgi:hypothetical protein
VSQQCTTGKHRQWHAPLLIAFSEPENHGATSLAQDQVGQFKVYEIADPAAGVK